MAKSTAKSGKPIRKPRLLDLSNVSPTAIRWLWPGRFALGRLSSITGRPGDGKSLLSIDMAARLTTGFGWPDGTPCPTGSVLFVACEDDPADTIRPRLDAAGADVSKVKILEGVDAIDPKTGKFREVPFTLQDVEAMESALKEMGDCKLVVIDPVGSYLGGGTDSHRDNEVRGVLAPIAKLAEKYGVAVIIVIHTRKSTAQYADDMALGSRAFTGIVRTSWHLMADQENKELRLLLPGKNNLSKASSGLAFRIETNHHLSVPAPQIIWEAGTVDKHADDLLAELNAQNKPGPDADAQHTASTWLSETLADGPRLAKELFDEWKNGKSGSERTLKRAKQSLGVEAYRKEIPGPWWWRLPSKNATLSKDEELGPLGTLAENKGLFPFSEDSDCKEAKKQEPGTLGDNDTLETEGNHGAQN